jgi:succinate dehydrogenase (ubiquinone) cytochrome b560 subunit
VPRTLAGFAAAGYIALTGDLPGALASFKANYPLLVFPTKLVISFPLVYHYLGGMRHFVWDLHKIGNQADKTSLLETPRVEQSSQILLGASVALSLLAAIL